MRPQFGVSPGYPVYLREQGIVRMGACTRS
jgi:hypothetical protein